jgi:hypothetical protein
MITINDDTLAEHIPKLCTNIFITIFTVFTNLTHLHFDLSAICRCSPTLFIDLQYAIQQVLFILMLGCAILMIVFVYLMEVLVNYIHLLSKLLTLTIRQRLLIIR